MANQNPGLFFYLKPMPVLAGEILLVQTELAFEKSICDFRALTHPLTNIRTCDLSCPVIDFFLNKCNSNTIMDVLYVDFHLSLIIFIGEVGMRLLHGRISMKNGRNLVPKER